MIRTATIIHPITVFGGVTAVQFILWALFFPEAPTVEFGEAKCLSGESIAYLGVCALFTVLGMYIGGGVTRSKPANKFAVAEANGESEFRFALLWGRCGALCASSAALYQVITVAQDSTLLANFFAPFGQHKIAAFVHEETGGFGLSTLACVSIGAVCMLAQPAFSPRASRHVAVRARRWLGATAAVMLTYSVFVMARQLFLLGALAAAVGWMSCRVIRVRVRWLLVLLLGVVAVVWGFSTLRTGLIYAAKLNDNLFGPGVQEYVWRELVEEYLPGEFNSACIILTYPSDPGSNWSYGTMLQPYVGSAYRPNREINTANSMALWYWQFGYGGIVVGFLLGLAVGRSYFVAIARRGVFALGFYTLVAPSLLISCRVNAFMIQTFVAPAAYIAIGWIVFSVHKSLSGNRRTSDPRVRASCVVCPATRLRRC